MEIAALVNRATVQIKNIDPLTIKEKLVEDLRRQWEMKSGESVDVRALRMTPWSTQVAMVLLPASAVPRKEGARRIRTDLTIASNRLLSDVLRCYKCRMLGHAAARCTMSCSGRELCRRCGNNEHVMKKCTTEPRCAMCCKHKGLNARHVTDSLACPMVRVDGRSRRR